MTNLIQKIKKEFPKLFPENPPHEGMIQSKQFRGCYNHSRAAFSTIAKIVKSQHILETGSWHYEGANALAKAMDEYGSNGVVDTFDIRKGGYDGFKGELSIHERVNPHFWMPYHSNYDEWKYKTDIVHPEFREMTNGQIYEWNVNYLKSLGRKYNLIILDCDHSLTGCRLAVKTTRVVANPSCIYILDDMLEDRLPEVRQFYSELDYPKYDFKDWNYSNPDKLVSMGVVEIGNN